MSNTIREIFAEIVQVRTRRMRRASLAGGQATEDEIDCLYLELLQAQLDLVRYDLTVAKTTMANNETAENTVAGTTDG